MKVLAVVQKNQYGMILLPIFLLLNIMAGLIYTAEQTMKVHQLFFHQAKASEGAFISLEHAALYLLEYPNCVHKTESVNEPLKRLSDHKGCVAKFQGKTYYYAIGGLTQADIAHQVIAVYAKEKSNIKLVLRQTSTKAVISKRYLVD